MGCCWFVFSLFSHSLYWISMWHQPGFLVLFKEVSKFCNLGRIIKIQFIMREVYCCIHHHYSSKNKLSTRASIYVEINIFGFFFFISRSSSTIVGLDRSHRWLYVSLKLFSVLSFLAPWHLFSLICLLRASSPSSLRSPRPKPLFSSTTSQLWAKTLCTEGEIAYVKRFPKQFAIFWHINLLRSMHNIEITANFLKPIRQTWCISGWYSSEKQT